MPRPSRTQDRPTLLVCVAPGLVHGIRGYRPANAAWELLLCGPSEISFVTANTRLLGLLGAIMHQVSPAVARSLMPPGLPTVLIDQAPQSDLLGIGSDGMAVGELAYRSLRARGFRRYGFWGVPGYWTSDQRQLGFNGAVATAGLTLHPETRPGLGTFSEIMTAGIAWLKAAPKPIAIFTDNTQRAWEMLWAARLAGLRVPEQVAILSGAEDPLLCTASRPDLSSIDIDVAELGRRAAALMDEAIGSRRPLRRSLLVAPRLVIDRGSTQTLADVPPPVAAGLACISAHAHHGIGVRDVVHAAGIPRRTLELAFRTSLDRSISEEIALARVARVRELLEGTRLDLVDIGARTGIGDPSQLCRLFTRHVGMGPRAYRQRYGLPAQPRGRASRT